MNTAVNFNNLIISGKNSANLLIPLSFTLLFGCTESKPDKNDALKIFEKSFNQQLLSSGVVLIDSIEKTNGQDSNQNGTPTYKLYFTAKYSFPKGFNPQCSPDEKQKLHAKQVQDGTWTIGGPAECANVEYRDVGEIVTYEGFFLFEKTDNGWRGPDKEVY